MCVCVCVCVCVLLKTCVVLVGAMCVLWWCAFALCVDFVRGVLVCAVIMSAVSVSLCGVSVRLCVL